MKINLNKDYLNDHFGLRLKRAAKEGIILAIVLTIGGVVFDKTDDSSELFRMANANSVSFSCDNLNQFSIIINDHNCGDAFFKDVCEQLKDDGIIFEQTSNCQNINQDNCLIITLDQQYNSGVDTIIFAPYDNTRLGDSDSLALSMQAAFIQKGILASNILCGKVGFRENSDGSISTLVPTDTEGAVNSNHNTSFVTISLGTSNFTPKMVAKSIEDGLVRQKHYLDNYDNQTDLIYRSSQGDSVQTVADYFDSTIYELGKTNNLKNLDVLDSQTIVNPNVKNIDSFRLDSHFDISPLKAKNY